MWFCRASRFDSIRLLTSILMTVFLFDASAKFAMDVETRQPCVLSINELVYADGTPLVATDPCRAATHMRCLEARHKFMVFASIGRNARYLARTNDGGFDLAVDLQAHPSQVNNFKFRLYLLSQRCLVNDLQTLSNVECWTCHASTILGFMKRSCDKYL